MMNNVENTSCHTLCIREVIGLQEIVICLQKIESPFEVVLSHHVFDCLERLFGIDSHGM